MYIWPFNHHRIRLIQSVLISILFMFKISHYMCISKFINIWALVFRYLLIISKKIFIFELKMREKVYSYSYSFILFYSYRIHSLPGPRSIALENVRDSMNFHVNIASGPIIWSTHLRSGCSFFLSVCLLCSFTSLLSQFYYFFFRYLLLTSSLAHFSLTAVL